MWYIVKIFAFLLLLPVFSSAQIKLPKILGHNMVLQQKCKVPIWGTATPGESIVVNFNKQIKRTNADKDGKWLVELNPMNASFDPQSLYIKSSKENIVLKNILIGEVWLCSGQSNMEFAMRKLAKLKSPARANWPINEVADAKNNNIRIFLVERKKMQSDSTHAGWTAATDPDLKNFSAVGYFFAKELYAKLKIPVGVISSAIPGSRIEPWIPEEAMKNISFFSDKKIDGDPGKFYTSMIEPLIPFSLKGFLWYQGESNCFLNERLEYSYKMKALIDYWRTVWKDQILPFYYVQIAPYNYSKATDKPYTIYSEPEFWEAQAAVLKMPNTTMIATIDLNDNPADLHPVNKWDVGKRLAEAALSKTYKISDKLSMGPILKNAVRENDKWVLSFSNTGKGLQFKTRKLKGFEIENANGEFTTADAFIKSNKIIIYGENIKESKSVRYAWRESAEASLYNSDGLPALPFRTNNQIINKFN